MDTKCSANGHINKLYCEMSTVWETKPWTTTSKDLLTVNWTGTGHSPTTLLAMW